MGKIEKVGDLESQNLSIKNNSRNTGIEKSHIALVKISPFRMKKFEINKPIQYETFFIKRSCPTLPHTVKFDSQPRTANIRLEKKCSSDNIIFITFPKSFITLVTGAIPRSRGTPGDGRTLPESIPPSGQPSARIIFSPGREKVGKGDRQEEPVVETSLCQVYRRHD